MDCAVARDVLSPPERPRASLAARLRARGHVRECAACRDFFGDDARLRAVLRRVLQQKAPPELRARVLAALAREAAVLESPVQPRAGRVIRSRRARWAVGIAAGLVIAVGLATVPTRQGFLDPRPERAGEIFIEDFLRRAVGEEQILSSDPAEVARFLTRELGRPAAPLVVPGLRIAKAEICLLGDKRGAMVVYDLDGSSVSHYLLPRTTRNGQPVAPSVRTVAGMEALGRPTVVIWKTASLEHALVAATSPGELEALVLLAQAGVATEPRQRLP